MTQPTPETIAGWERANRQFHMALIAGCPSRWLLRFTASLYDQWQRYRHRTVLRRAIPRRGLSAEHKELIKLTLAREADAACAALSAHIENTARTAEAAIFESIPIKAAPNSIAAQTRQSLSANCGGSLALDVQLTASAAAAPARCRARSCAGRPC